MNDLSRTIVILALIAGIALGASSCFKAMGNVDTERGKTERLQMLIKAGWTNHLDKVQ